MARIGTEERNVERFNRDVAELGGYRYTAEARLSSLLANARISRAVQRVANLKGKRVVDIGCGDGTYTLELLAYEPAFVLGIDPAAVAIEQAQAKTRGIPNIGFKVWDMYRLGELEPRFDVGVLRGVLHHLDDAAAGIAAACRSVREVIVVEPNGLNPVLKVIERTSRYHIEHGEKSYRPVRVDKWFAEHGAKLESVEFLCIVPFFCPDWMARTLSLMEPLFEALPVVNRFACGHTVKLYTVRP